MSGRLRSTGATSLLVCLLAGALWIPPVAHAATLITVPGDFPTIQAAVDAAQSGDTVRVSPGTYVGRVSVDAKNITIESVAGPANTIIDGNQTGHAVYLGGGPTGNPTLRGFTVRNAADTGIITAYGTPLIEGDWVVDNTSCGGGSGIEAAFSGATIRGNLIARNLQGGCSGGTGGGGILVRGAGTVTIANNTIEDNRNQSGGGISLFGAGNPTISGNVIRRNHTGTSGGGISLANASDAVIVNNLFQANDAAQGGGIAAMVPSGSISLNVINNTFADNQALEGAAIYANGFDAASRYANNVVVGSSTQPAFECTTLYDPTPPIVTHNEVFNPGGAEYSAGCGSPTGMDGNVSVDPLLVDPLAGDFHLRADSPLIDAGTNTGAPATDFDGDARPHDGDEDGVATVDIGFDEAIEPVLVVPPSLRFDDTTVGAPAPTVSTVLTNLGSSPMTVSSVSIAGADQGDFTLIGQTCTGAAIAVDTSCTVSVGFTPGDIGDRSAHVTLTGPAPFGTHVVALHGIGMDPILVTPGSLGFGAVPLGATSTPLTVNLFDYGVVPVDVTSVAIGGTDAADFTIASEDCTTAPVPVAMACPVSVTFKPSAIGARTASLTITGPSPVGTRVVPLTGTGAVPASGVSWGGTAYAGPGYTWNAGGALGQTVQSGAQRLHLAYATYRIGSKWATDTGPFGGIYYTKSSSGSTWTTPIRINPTNQHAARVGLAAYGSRVYVTWVSQTRIVKYSGTQPRVLYVRTNTNHGAATSWKTTIRLSPTTGRVDYPTITATGSDVHIAWTDSVSGTIRVATSRNAGSTWTTRSLGSATISTTSGRTGIPSVSANGATVAVVWLADAAGTIKGRVSTDHGSTWGPLVTVGTQSRGFASVAVRGNRIAVSWATADDVVVRQRLAGIWGAPITVASLVPGAPPQPYAPVVTLQDPSRIAVAWSEELDDINTSNLRWVESADGGTRWFQPQTLAATSSTRAANDWASVVWPTVSAGRMVVWNGWTPNSSAFRLYFRKGLGAPVGPTVASTTWAPSGDAPHITTNAAPDAGTGSGSGSPLDRGPIGPPR